MLVARALLGLVFLCGVALLLSSDRRRVPWRIVLVGLGTQLGLALLLLGTDIGRGFFEGLAGYVTKLISMTEPGARLVFGPLSDPAVMASVFGEENKMVFAFAGQGLTVILFLSALTAILYHLGIMQVVVWALARVMSVTMGVSGAEAMAMAANVFVGNTEAPLVVRPYVPRMTLSELNALMTGGFATIAGTVLAVYMKILDPSLAPHLLTASVLSAPAAFVFAKLIRPEVETSETAGRVELRVERTATNLIEAAANGTTTGVKLWLNIMAMLVAFIALVTLVDWPLGSLGELFGMAPGELGLSRVLGWIFAPVAWLIGVEGWHDSQLLGSLLGTKIAVNEFLAFIQMQGIVEAGGAGTFASPRTAAMGAYALCGFANFGSIGIQLGGLAPLAPERRADLSRIVMKAMVGGALASWSTACIAGMFLEG